MTKKMLSFLFIVFVVGSLAGCASIISGQTQSINVTTASGNRETIEIDGMKYTVPAIISLKRENRDKIITLENCPDQKVLLKKNVNLVFFVNLLSGGAFGSTTDYATGAMWEYGPDNVTIQCPNTK